MGCTQDKHGLSCRLGHILLKTVSAPNFYHFRATEARQQPLVLVGGPIKRISIKRVSSLRGRTTERRRNESIGIVAHLP